MNNSITKKVFQPMLLVAFLYCTAACMQTSKDKDEEVQVQLTLKGSGGSGGGTGGSSRDTTLVTTGKVTGGILKLEVPAILAPGKGTYQLDKSRDHDNNAMRLVRYVKMSSDTGGSSPDTLYYKAPRDGKDDDDDRR